MATTLVPLRRRVAADDFVYTGSDNLEVMADAVNYNRFLLDSVIGQVPSPEASVLDFGAGAGTYADMMAERGIRPDVLEPDAGLQRLLTRKGHRVVDLAEGDVPAGGYDVVYTLNVLEHIKNDQEVCEQLAELLKSGGRLVVYVPAFDVLFTAMDEKVGHYRRYRRRQLERILSNAGLEIVESRYCDPAGFFATLAYRFAGSSGGSISPLGLKAYDRLVFPMSRALQRVTGRVFGKNVLVVATRR
ncbi:class I SAM-dependent methyltransferase [Mumia sp. zg.B53]|uniref:class I SAM-dependent methyltransferase n=1 Tax=Mumia sp. zg.B53 TaxID=2855449 RepID=UPI001C6E868D|nr:class I SAM-dependent methyltransferase [Mumia sp. zg.B53]MBW9214093.1 class I SAM-dependent methyltransferase [Mumia sp. zg.B53]